ncbi:MotA/TolQ/ExbB proton channel family protein [Gilvibacter sp.]
MIKIISEGGYFFMVPLAALLIAVIILGIRGNINSNHSQKAKHLLQSLGLFALVWGILGQVLGLIEALDTIEFIDGVTMNIVAGGLKRTFLPTFLGAIVFLFARFGIIIIQWREREATAEN